MATATSHGHHLPPSWSDVTRSSPAKAVGCEIILTSWWAGSSAELLEPAQSLANVTRILMKTRGAITLIFVPLCSINSSKVVPRFERFGLGVLESSNPKM